jgi:hypothetical protein
MIYLLGVGGNWGLNTGLCLAQQVVYHLSHAISPQPIIFKIEKVPTLMIKREGREKKKETIE